MAIILTKDIQDFYPAYNDSFVEFSSDTNSNITATVTVNSVNFQLTSFDGRFLFNFNQLSKLLFNSFEDKNEDGGLWIQRLNDAVNSLNVTYNIGADTLTRTYSFVRAVSNIGDYFTSSSNQILSYSKNAIDYNLTYFEGMPFWIDYKHLEKGDIMRFESYDNKLAYEVTALETGAQRIWFDKSYSSTTNTMSFPLHNHLNNIHVSVNGVFKHNLNIHKKSADCGIALKWANNEGGYNTFQFSKYFRETLRASSIGSLTRNDFSNVGEGLNSNTYSQGKESSGTLRLKAICTDNELEYVRSILESPSIEMYSSQESFTGGLWSTVEIDGNIATKTKQNRHTINLTVELPTRNTLRY